MTGMRLSRLALLVLLALWSARVSAFVTYNVNDPADHPDDIHDGVCADAFGKCTLRAAIMEANLGTDFYVRIVLPAGTYTLMRGVTNPDDHSNGDLDIGGRAVRIDGAGAAKTIIDANHVDRAFKVSAGGGLELHDLTIRNGQPSSFGGRLTAGGAIYSNGDVYMSGCVLDSNTAIEGGAVEMVPNASSPSLIAIKSTFSRNGAASGGGGVFGFGVDATFDACTFATNTSGYGGGIAMVSSGHLHMQNTTLYQNDVTDSGGGIYLYGVTADLHNLTLGGNAADSDADANGTGGGIVVSNSTVTMSGSVLANLNDSTHGNDDCVTSNNSTLTFSGGMLLRTLAGCGYNGFAYEGDPLLGVLKDNGGPTWTEMPSPSSLAVNQGNPAGCAGISGTLTVDQRGVKRPIGAACDLGAVELEPIGDANGDGTVDLADVFYVINFLFAGGPVPLGRANVNGGSVIDVADVFYLINYLFAGGPPPV
jgi:hypothetical protein